MFNQKRVLRVFQLINYLKSEPPKTNLNLSRLLGITGRSVYRYMDLLEEMGIKVEKDMHGKFFIPSLDSNQPVFTTQEASFLAQLMQTVGSENPLSESILSKINSFSELEIGTHFFHKAHLAKIVENLAYAIANKKQVLLKSYYSAHSQSISDRLIEPVCFTDNYTAISAFELTSKSNKLFNIERISEVLILDSDFVHEDSHTFYKPDIFGFQGKNEPMEIEWNMSLRASLLLKEEYPLSQAYIRPIPQSLLYHFKAPIHSFKGPGRFVMGFFNEIEVIGSDKFIKYLKRAKKGK